MIETLEAEHERDVDDLGPAALLASIRSARPRRTAELVGADRRTYLPSPTTLWVVDGVGRHLGNVMVATIPGMRWSIGPNRVRTNYRNQPVVTDQGDEDHNPLRGVATVASRNLKGLANNGPDSPWDYYEMRAAYWRSKTLPRHPLPTRRTRQLEADVSAGSTSPTWPG